MWRGNRADYEEISNYTQILSHCSSSSTRGDNAQQHQLNVSPEVVYKIYGFKFCWTRVILYNVIALIPFLGLPHLLALWFPIIRTWRYKKCNLSICDYVLVENNIDVLQLLPTKLATSTAQFLCTDDPIEYMDSEEASEEYYLASTDRPLCRYFDFEEIRYICNIHEGVYTPLQMPHNEQTIQEICDKKRRFYNWHRELFLNVYGPNKIRVDVKSYWKLFKQEIINPFYLFQIFSITLWSLDDYYYYAACVLTLSAISIGTSLYQTKKQSVTLRELVEKSRPAVVSVLHYLWRSNPSCEQMSPENLVPGDVLVLENGMILPCDCLLVDGSCIVNECMLTGESVPVNKVAVDTTDPQMFNENRYKRNILYSGTEIIQLKRTNDNNNYTTARVLNIGFSTSQGQLIKSILYPKPIGFKFYKDSMRFVMMLFCCAVFGMLYSVRLYLKRNEDIRTMIFGTLDVITIIVPPSLPMAMTAGTIYSQNRLQKKGIFCVSPPQINVCGKMKLCCFDKTGTLTEDGLTYLGHLNVGIHGGINETLKKQMPMNLFDRFVQGMATCHSLIPHDNDLLGDPLDLEMFRQTDWQLMESTAYLPAPRSVIPASEIGKSLEHDLPYVIGIYKDFEFTSEKQSMSVIVQILGHDNFVLFAKGAPEKIRGALMEGTMPSNFDSVLNRYAKSGYRILALAYKEFPPKAKLPDLVKKKRETLEKDLIFLGFVVFENSLKPETVGTVRDLIQADLRVVMATGDNILTAVAVARESGIVGDQQKIYKLHFDELVDRLTATEVGEIEGRRRRSREGEARVVEMENEFPHHFAMDGTTWEAIRRSRPELIPRILTRGTIFARFRPEQKSELLLGLQDMDYIVTMCGDGANDCAALKAANIGVSLSQAEASVAAPFTYKKQNIECIRHLALEGRCALVTSFAIFRYMILYSVIQFCAVLILYTYCTTLGNFQFLFIDLVITASIAFSMGLQEPTNILGTKRPSSSLISPNNVIPLVIQIIACVGMQLGATLLLTNQWWYPDSDVEHRCVHNDTMSWRMPVRGLRAAEKPIVCWENTVVFLTSCFQYMVLGLVYSKGKPFRKPFYSNITFMALFGVLMTFTLILLLQPPEPLAKFFELQSITDSTPEENIFRYYLLIFPLIHIFTALAIEFGIAERSWLKKTCHFITQKTRPRNKFRILEKEFNLDWVEFSANK